MIGKIILYSTGCPKCNVLKRKLDEKNIKYEIVDDIDKMQEKGFTSAPMLEVDGSIFDFSDAIIWLSKSKI